MILALVYTALRLAVHGGYLAMMLYPEAGILGGTPEWAGAEGEPMVPVDLQVYLDAAENLLEQENLYLQGPITRLEDLYQYTPAFALVSVPFLHLSALSVSVLHTLLHIAAYAWLYLAWAGIFDDLDLVEANQTLALTLPLWLLFSAFWSDLGYLNIYIVMALLSTLLIHAILREKLAWSVFWLSLILQIKPQWAFAAAVPLLLGRSRFFLRLVAWSILAYAGIMLLTMVAAGPAYVARQYAHYARSLSTLPSRFPWRGPEAPFLGYNHSIKQTIIYVLGESVGTLGLATAIKLLLLVPLGLVSGRYLVGVLRGVRLDPAPRDLDLAFALYLGAFIWLDMVWELSLGIAVFAYLLATSERPRMRGLIWGIFTPYALIDLWQLVSLGISGMDVMAPGPYILTDPSIYIPMTMMLILVFYAIVVSRLWPASRPRWETSVC